MYEIFEHDIMSNILIHQLSVFYNLKTFITFILFYFPIGAFMYISRHPFTSNIKLIYVF
jgi:hypothetical protein